MLQRIRIIAGILILCSGLLIFYLVLLMHRAQYLETAVRQSQTVLTAGTVAGTIYDRKLRPLVNRTVQYYAAAPPTAETIAALLSHTEEMAPLLEGIRTGEPFLCRVDTDAIDCDAVTILELPERGTGHLTGQHVLGYTLEGIGITGLEADYNDMLRGEEDTVSVTYTVDARGKALAGVPPLVSSAKGKNTSLVTTLDARIQAICEAQPIEKGAVMVMDVRTGDVLAMASFPSYDPDHLGEALADENAPLINRCLYPYSVGSIFKLVTCATAYRQHLARFQAVCTGQTTIRDQVFRCHDWRGHGMLDMEQAMVYSCNTYFVELSQLLDPDVMRSTAQDFGYGTQFALTRSIISQSGTLPTSEELSLPAERANFSFGQGKLTATPLQVTQMTCCIANNGSMPLARLVRGMTEDGIRVGEEQTPRYARILNRKEAYFLQGLMIAAINQNENSNAVPDGFYAAAKTSTAQTGRFDADGTEYCHGWITGYFPIDAPKYAITVLAEDAGYGNDAAAPVFRTVAEAICKLETSKIR